jgi:hypothetical protein
MLVATLALFIAMGGSALAARRYLITSTKQISPRVLKALNGRRGATGKQGPIGPRGPQGKEGPPGKEGKTGSRGEAGPFPSALPSGKTLTGVLQATDAIPAKQRGSAEATISFQFPLTFNPKVEVVQASGKTTENCPGRREGPSAAPGYLCIYILTSSGAAVGTYNPANEAPGAGRAGAVAFTEVTCAGASSCNAHLAGTWAVTAP